ncbi:MAG: DNA primase [Coriobacteriia bacterium]|nr:DNA primase [Coriobacteriia bacterium]
MINQDDIGKVRDATDLVSLIGSRVVLKQRRTEFWGCCPFHNEKTPSFKVDPVSQFYYCFGCGESGDAFTFTMKTENVDFLDSVRLLAQRANIELTEDAADPQRGRKARLLEVAAATEAFYQTQLLKVRGYKNDQARSYLAGRGFGGDVAKRWRLGFAPGGGQLTAYLQGLGFSSQEMADTDVARSNSDGGGERHYDRFYDRIIFPIADLQGRTIAFGGRIFLPTDESPAKYLNSAETSLFKKRDNLYALDLAKSAIVSEASAIVVEGYTDTIALHEAGFTNTVATLGTALTIQHLRLLARFTEKVILLFDGDEAGQRAAGRAMDLIATTLAPNSGETRRADVFVALLPGTLDPADFVASQGPDALHAVLDAAVSLVRYSIDRTLLPFDLASPEQRSRAEAAAAFAGHGSG